MSDIKTVLRDIGAILIIVGIVSLITLIVPISYGEYGSNALVDGVFPMLLTSAIYLLVGIPLYYFFRGAEPATFKTAMITAALGWFVISLIGSIPFWMMPYDKYGTASMDLLSGFFESMSGWTGTGLTMVDNEELLPYTLQFWRTFIQWVGGVGVIVLTLSILARPGTGSYVLYKGEARDQKTHPSIVSTVRTIWWIFSLYTIIGIILLIIAGYISTNQWFIWESINHAMTGIATGGFSVTNYSITGYDGLRQFIIIILMIFGAIAFASHYSLLNGRFKKFLSDAQFRALVVIIIIGVFLLTVFNAYAFDSSFTSEFSAGAFQFISALTCTGFASVESIVNWPDSAKLILSFAMVIGGAAGSTAGGIKLFRAILLYKGVGWRIKRSISTPRRVFVHKLGDKPLSKENAMDLINEAAIISFMWIILLGIGVMLLSVLNPQIDLSNIIFEVCSAQGNVGLTAGITSMANSEIEKLMLIINMWVGRLEIIPIIVLFRSLLGVRRNII